MAPNKQIMVSLGFSADTQKAKQQINDLQNTLSKLSKTTTIQLVDDASVKSSLNTIDKLRASLQSATDIKTGKLDLSKFNKSLTDSHMTLTQYGEELIKLGPEGTKAFMQLGDSILTAEAPLRKTNKLLKDTWDNLKKTAGWQFSSSVIHGLQGAVQSAYYYAEDLNRSLNDIRIVSGKSADEMERFAVQANKAAKNLSATTLDYTNAALIYYQQGLSEDEVIKRTDVTVKMANVTRESTEDVSSYMTAIWNNFDDGSKSLEYYGDVMTALGAATASSTEEIAAALEKFASIGDTVGLSYEYATSAVATVVDKTRQSADSVGTSFRTIFSRLSSLSLGETLDDGVTLTKYTEALDKVGVDALDANGKLRDMDDILDDLGKRWDTLGKSEKNAMAQTVAGVRQYNNLIALLDNYDAFKDNVGVAEGSTGTLQEQADIYAESWEAARDRVQASWEDIYTSILDDDFFIGALDAFADLLDLVDKLIDGAGGLTGIFFGLSSALIAVNKESMADGLRGLKDYFNYKQKVEDTDNMKKGFLKAAADIKLDGTGVSAVEYDAIRDMTRLRELALQYSDKMNETDAANFNIQLEKNKLLRDNNLELAKQADLQSKATTKAITEFKAETTNKNGLNKDLRKDIKELLDLINEETIEEKRKGYEDSLSDEEINTRYFEDNIAAYVKYLTKEYGVSAQIANNLIDEIIKSIDIDQKVENSENIVNKHTKEMENGFEKLKKQSLDWADGITVAAENLSNLGAIATGLSSVGDIISGLSDGTLSWADALTQTIGMIRMLTPSIVSLTSARNAENIANLLSIETTNLSTVAIWKNIAAKIADKAITVVQNPVFWLSATAITAVGVAVKILAKEWNKEKDAAEASKKSLDGLNDSYQQITAKVNSFKEAISNYDEGIAALDKLTKGTNEYKEAVEAANEETRKLIEEYGLYGKAYYNEDGVLVINEEDIEEAQNNLINTQNSVNNARLLAEQDYNNKQLEANKKSLMYKTGFNETNEDRFTYITNLLNQQSKLGLDLTNANEVENFLKDTGGFGPKYIDSISKAAVELANFAQSTEDATEKNKDLSLQITKGITDNKYADLIAGAGNNSDIAALAIARLNSGNQDYTLTNEDIARFGISNQYKYGNIINKDSLLNDYLSQVQGLNATEIDKINIESSSKGITAKNGEDTLFSNMSYDDMIQQLAYYQQQSELTGSFEGDETAQAAIEKLLQSDSPLVGAVLSAIANGATGIDLSSYIAENYSPEGVQNLIGNKSDITSQIDLAPEEWAALGFENGNALLEGLNQALENYDAKDYYDNVIKKQQAVSEAFGTLEKDGILDKDAIQALRDSGEFEERTEDDWNRLSGMTGIEQQKELSRWVEDYNKGLAETIQLEEDLRKEMEELQKVPENDLFGYEDAQVRIKEIEEQLESLGDINIENTMFDIMENQVLDITSNVEQLKDAAMMIGEGFIVAKEDAQAFADIYPQLMELAQVQADGSIQLNQEVVQNALNGDATLIKSQTEVVANNLQNKIDMLQAELEFERVKTEILDNLLSGNISQSEAEQQLSEVTSKYQTTMSSIAAKAEIEDKIQLSEADKEFTNVKLENLDKLGQAVVNYSKAYNAAMSGEIATYTSMGKTAAGSGNINSYVESITEEDWKTADELKLEDEVYNSIKQTIQESTARQETLSKQIAAYTTLKSKLYSGTSSALTALDNAASGRGNNEKTGGSSSNTDKEIERYHYVKEVLQDINQELEMLDKAKSIAWGSDKLKLIEDETAALERELAKEQEYLKEIEGYLALDKLAAASIGATFDENGNITNWEELMESGSEEVEDILNQYEETENLLDEKRLEIMDKELALFDKHLELIEEELNTEITMSEDTMEYLDYLLDKVERSTYNAAREIAILGRQAKETVSQIESQSDAIHKTLAEVGAEGLFDGLLAGEVSREQLAEAGLTADAIDSVMDSVNEVWSKNLELLDINEQVATAILDDFNQFMEDMDTEISKMEHLISLTESYRNIIELTGQEALGITDELLEAAGQAIVEQNKNILAASKDRLDAAKRERAALAEQIEREKAAGMDTTELEKTLAKMDAEIQEASESFMSAWEEALQSASDQFDQSMEMAIKRFGTAIAGAAGNLDNLQTLMDRQQEIDDRYLEDYAKIYELTKLNRDITNSIDNTDNIKGKQELKKLQEEINALQDGNTQMSQYEVDHLRAKYELRLAEIALEEAQNAKSQVRMTRDAEGNWSYTYTADTDNIDSAQQNYEDKLYALQKLNDEYIEEMSGRMAQIGQEMADALAALDVTASDYQQRYNETTAYYTDQLDYYTQQINISLGNNSELYYNDWKDYSTATGYKLSDAQDYVMQFNDTMLGMATGYQSATQFQTDFNAAIGDVDTEGTLLYDSKQAYEQWKTDVEEIFQEAGTSVEGFKDDYRDFLFDEETGVEKTSKDAAAAVEEMSERMKTAMSNALDAAKTFAEQYSGYMKTATDGLLTFNQQQQEQEEKNKEDEKEQKQKEEEEDKNNKGGSVAPVLRVGAAVALKAGTKGWYDSYGSSPYWVAGSSGTIKYTNEGAPYAYNIDGMGWVKKSDIVGYDTGGYTGAWGSSGKIGMLHEKELVLNQSDTQNFLDGILTLREITDMIDLRASAMGRDSLLGSLTTPAFDNPIVQNIEINAEFPDAVYQDEIKAAFSSLVNEASQYANRKG